ncbi:hypothetical protein LEP1GSC058_0296 [Leptospira fainei serovar Hurstbridge str. BUT 6]|uniref:Uncharacterized protein n=1 Tax=Leptospira fainei serovar Hurstbridge str. BUT 6 TaxID=1193011 RepID=S3V069_9LEPT|nr:hypothetical protein [Leptospira fainei]EPG76041.1 hypothetical protein LEP1GSC058_0296 [Leptospira fainei serovar Hurstbridge str. BUT 6]
MGFIIKPIVLLLLACINISCKEKTPYEKYYSDNFIISDAKELNTAFAFTGGGNIISYAHQSGKFKQTYLQSCLYIDPYKKILTFSFAKIPGTFNLKIINYIDDNLYIANDQKEVIEIKLDKPQGYAFKIFDINSGRRLGMGAPATKTLQECKESYEDALDVEGNYSVPRGPTD